MIIAGDWNSYILPATDIFRRENSNIYTTTDTDRTKIQHLRAFVNDLRSSNVFLFNPMAKEKLQAEEHYTFLSNSHRFQSILDKTFTTFPTEHCESTQILDWHTYSKVGLSDHRVVVTQVSLSSLCEGWIEYPSKPFRLPPRIDITKLTEESKTKMQEAIEVWKRGLPDSIASILLSSPLDSATGNPEHVDMGTLQAMHKQLTELFVDIPERFIQGSQPNRKGNNIKRNRRALRNMS